MARKPISTATRVAVGPSVKRHDLKGLEVLTLTTDQASTATGLEGKIVRLIPNESDEEHKVSKLAMGLTQSGALAVKVLPIPRSRLVSKVNAEIISRAIDDLQGVSNRGATIVQVIKDLVKKTNLADSEKDPLLKYCLGLIDNIQTEEGSDVSDQD